MLSIRGPSGAVARSSRSPGAPCIRQRPAGTAVWAPGRPSSLLSLSLLTAHASKGGQNLDETRETLAKAMAMVEALQRTQAEARAQAAGAATPADGLAAREQQLWDRQQGMYDRMLAQWDAERQAWQQREAALVQQVEGLQQQLMHFMWQQSQAQAQAQVQQQQRASGAGGNALPAGPQLAGALPPPTAGLASPYAAPGYSATGSFGGAPAEATATEDPSQPGTPVSDAVSARWRRRQQQQQQQWEAGGTGGVASPGSASSSAPAWAELFSAAVAEASESATEDAPLSPPPPPAAAPAPPAPTRAEASSASAAAAPFASADASGAPLPRFAQELAAAIALVDGGDVLTDDLDLPALRRRRESGESSGSEAGTKASPAAAAAAAAPDTASTDGGATSEAEAAAGARFEVVRAPPAGPPPLLSTGDDDIFWVAKLHSALGAAGCYPPDEEAEDFIFAEGTQAALLAYQAVAGLDETGLADEPTWRSLLGDDAFSSSSAAPSDSDAPGPSGGTGTAGKGPSGGGGAAAASGRSKWPTVMDQDGGREVHAMHVALMRKGFFCGDDDMRWWMFGDSTMTALRTFQASSGLPESGVCDERTWLALLGAGAAPSVIDELEGSDSEYEEDLSGERADGAVWLLGEQRWSRPV